MCSKKELEQELDKLPPTPYKPTADLREVHRLFHEAAEINASGFHLIHNFESKADISSFADSIKPTSLGLALQLTDNIRREVFESGVPDGSDLVLILDLRIYLEHNPPNKVQHKY
jgi:hypothetical protein